jgi:hypothetical protein
MGDGVGLRHVSESRGSSGGRAARSCRALMHPNVQWTTYKGDVLSRDQYIAGITGAF